MRTERNGAIGDPDQDAVMRTFVRARVASKPEFVRSSGGVGVCRIPVIGDGNLTTSPPRLSLYVRDGGGKLNPEEARRCAFGLRPGDVIQAVGAVGAERPKARHQEVVVDEPVKLRARAAGTVGAA